MYLGSNLALRHVIEWLSFTVGHSISSSFVKTLFMSTPDCPKILYEGDRFELCDLIDSILNMLRNEKGTRKSLPDLFLNYDKGKVMYLYSGKFLHPSDTDVWPMQTHIH